MIASLIARAGYRPEEPVLVAVRRGSGPATVVVQASAGHRGPTTADDRCYIASLSKQFTAACAALLFTAGRLDIDSPLARWLPELPAWSSTIRLRHLVHHLAGLPADGRIDDLVGDQQDRTSTAVIAALARFPALDRPPGTAFGYSNAGYVCLAIALERAAGQQLPDLASQHIFEPLGLRDTLYWPGPQPTPPMSTPLPRPHPAPLSLGDGGVWSTAADLLRWSQAMNADALGVSALLHTAGRLNDGRPVDYGWGIGIRRRAGHTVYRHGGGWPGVRLLLASVPDLDASLVIIATADETERRIPLADALLDTLVDPPPNADWST